MTALRTLIADDEEPAREKLRAALADLPDVDVVAICGDGRETIAAIRALTPTLAFLDIQMPEMNGFDVLAALEPAERPPAIVFVTAHDAFAIRAFEVNAMDYLLKPYTRDRLEESVRRARARLADPAYPRGTRLDAVLAAIAARSAAPERLPVRTKDGVEFVRVAEIDWMQADGNYCRLVLGRTELRLRGTIAEFEEKLAGAGFIRVHRSFLVNRESIFRIEPWANGEYVLVLRDGRKLNTGRGYGERVRALFA